MIYYSPSFALRLMSWCWLPPGPWTGLTCPPCHDVWCLLSPVTVSQPTVPLLVPVWRTTPPALINTPHQSSRPTSQPTATNRLSEAQPGPASTHHDQLELVINRTDKIIKTNIGNICVVAHSPLPTTRRKSYQQVRKLDVFFTSHSSAYLYNCKIRRLQNIKNCTF